MHLNRSAVSPFDYPTSYVHPADGTERQTKSRETICSLVRLRDLFVTSDRYAFDAHDHIVSITFLRSICQLSLTHCFNFKELCTCTKSLCNNAHPASIQASVLWTALFAIATVLINACSLDLPRDQHSPFRASRQLSDSSQRAELFEGSRWALPSTNPSREQRVKRHIEGESGAGIG